ncbi:hypothetical protein [Paraflavitalea sp. CAU 1676]|uniref:hypothetical protein n=1 Tax=Paraflavitalea sp. CAU 1676 TaxID=3032598 RepID=UPI0023DB5A41|nr:hypothetical protein [Paraflavitalea sp. CAU 1676]MDF2191993.1 hypothetical protein [Paraflavitalea sp. CAU 1676]
MNASKRSGKKMIMALAIAAMTMGIISTFSTEAKAVVEPPKGNWVETNCVCPGGKIVGNSNNCNPGTANCNDNDCSHTSCGGVS